MANRLKHVVYVYNKEKKSKHQLKLKADGKSHTEGQIYTVQQDSAIQYHGSVNVGISTGPVHFTFFTY
jgi:hypothetical protein